MWSCTICSRQTGFSRELGLEDLRRSLLWIFSFSSAVLLFSLISAVPFLFSFKEEEEESLQLSRDCLGLVEHITSRTYSWNVWNPSSLSAFPFSSPFFFSSHPSVIAPLFQRTKPTLSGHSERFIKTRNGVIVNRHHPSVIPPFHSSPGHSSLVLSGSTPFWGEKRNNSLWRLK